MFKTDVIYALIFLKFLDKDIPITVQFIAESTSISQYYLEQLALKLKRAGIVRGSKGRGGGYTLEQPYDAVIVREIVRVTKPKDYFKKLNTQNSHVKDIMEVLSASSMKVDKLIKTETELKVG